VLKIEGADMKELLTRLETDLKETLEQRTTLDKKAVALQKTIAGIRELIGLNDNSEFVQFTPISEVSVRIIAPNQFAGMTITQAAVAYLRWIDEPQTNRQVAEALLKGGIKSNAQNFPSTLRSVLLKKQEKNSPVVWLDTKWHLREWILEMPPEERPEGF
jgi:hypothetical protein